MKTIPGYTLASVVSESGGLVLCHATPVSGGEAVLLKLPSSPRPEPSLLRRLEHEFEVARDLDGDCIARPLVLERYAGTVAMVLEPGPTRTLVDLLGRPMDIQLFLRTAMGLVAALAEIHNHEFVHKDLKPDHVLLDATGHVWLTGLGVASRVPRERQEPEPPEVIVGTLAYMAPEQTGRMNRSVDSRSDLYALGVTLYQMLTGALPFTASDPMEWVHCHIARQPVPPAQRVAGIPGPLSDMVMKLLAKTAEERYPCAASLEADLHHCQAEWDSRGRIDVFPLGAHDPSGRLRIPERLYGRESEIEALLAAFDRVVASGTPEMVLISGYSGIGKSSVVHEIHKALVPPRGLFAAGKFDQYKRDIPYATLVQALQVLVRQILGRSEAEVKTWRDAVEKAVSPNGQLIVSLIPEIEFVIGRQPPVPDLPPLEAQNRFQMVLHRFLGVFARPEHPLALFLDDLQWLDGATLEFLRHFATEPDVRCLLLIGAYRSNEVTASHPLVRTLEAIRQAGTRVREIELAPIGIGDVASLIADALHCDGERALPLARLVHEKTGGNPFFAIQFVTALAEEKLLVFDPGAGAWTWDLGRIHAKGFSDNVVDLMLAKLGRLPGTTQNALEQFACLGNVARTATLSMVRGQSEDALHAALWEAVRAGLVFRVNGCYTFLHDRVQEAAYALVPEAGRKQLHLKIGRLLLEQGSAADMVFDVVNQFNHSVEIVADNDERATIRRLNTEAGRRARGAIAYSSAVRYLGQAAALLPPDSWNTLHDETLALFLDLAECEYLVGNFSRSDDLLTVLLEKARSLLDRARVLRLRQRLYQLSGRYHEAMVVALEALRLFAVKLPDADEDIRAATDAEILQVPIHLGGRRIADLVDAPMASDPEMRALIGLLAEAMPLIYTVRPLLWPLITARGVNLCLQHGHADETPFVYSCYTMVLVSLCGDIPSALAFSEMTLELNERLPGAAALRGKLLFHHAAIVTIWCRHFAMSMPMLEQAFLACLDAGDIVCAGFLTYNAVWLRLESGDALDTVIEVARRYGAFLRQSHNDVVHGVVRIEEQFAACLRGSTQTSTSFSDDTFHEAECVAGLEKAGFRLGIAYYHIMKLLAAFIDERYEEALEHAGRAEPMLLQVASMANEATFHFYHALALTALYDQVPVQRQRHFTEVLERTLQKLKLWAVHGPENFAHRYALVSAEVARIEGRDLEAMRLYDVALRAARDNGFVHHEALVSEIAARFYRARGVDSVAEASLRDARACYVRWGAQGKVRQLEQGNPHLRETVALAPTATFATDVRTFDFLAVVQASQAISGEILLPNLLETLMRIMVETAGARSGYLLLSRSEELSLVADVHVERQDVVVRVHSETGVPQGLLPASILNYVRGSRDTVILDEATGPHPYAGDEYFARRQPRSVLCVPITRQTRLVGLLYLENDLATHAFTSDRQAVLSLLAAQTAISLENALVYEALQESEERFRRLSAELDERVTQRTAELESKNVELARLNRVFVGRELRMIELKQKLRDLQERAGDQPS